MCFSAYACKWKVQHQNSSSLSKEITGWRGYLVRLEGQFLSILCELSLACLLPPASGLGPPPPNLHYKRTGSSVSKWPWKVQTKALLNSIIWNAEILYEMLPSIAMATWCHPVTEQASQHLAETVLLPWWAKRWFWKWGPSWAKEHLQSKHFCSPLGEEKPLSLLLSDHGAGSNHAGRRRALSRRERERRINCYQSVYALKPNEKGRSWEPDSADRPVPWSQG